MTRQRIETPAWDGPTECKQAIVAFFRAHAADEELSKNAVEERLRARRLSYRTATIGDALEQLAVEAKLSVRTGARNARLFRLPSEEVPNELF